MADLVGDDGFQTAALCAAIGAVAVALLTRKIGGGPRRNPWAGLVFAGAAVAGLAYQNLLPDDLVTALAVVAVGGLVDEVLTRRVGRNNWAVGIQALAVVPGAWLVADSTEVDDPAWVAPAVFLAIVAGSALAADFDRWAVARGSDSAGVAERLVPGLPPVLLAVTVAGIWATVPETEHAVVLVGAAVPVAFLGWPRPLAPLGGTGSALVVALLAWTTAVDGIEREGSIVGGLACLGVFVLEPITRRIAVRRRFAEAPDRLRRLLVPLLAHVGLVAFCSRVAGLQTGAAIALVFGVAGVVAAAGGMVIAADGTRHWSGRPRA